MQKFKDILLIFSLIAIAIMVFLLSEKCPQPQIITHTDTIYTDTIYREVKVKVPVPIRIKCPEIIPFPSGEGHRGVDTIAIINEFLCTRYYRDTITDDSTYYAIIDEAVSANEIISRQFWHKNLRPSIINYHITNEFGRLYIGPYMDIGPKSGIGLQLIYVQNRKFLITTNIDFLNKTAGIGYIFKIK